MKNYVAPKPPTGYDMPPFRFTESVKVSAEMLGPDTLITRQMLQTVKAMPHTDYTLMMWELAGVQRWIKYGMPNLFPSDEIVWGCQNTEALTSVTGRDLKTTYPSVMIHIPRRHRWQNGSGHGVSHLIVNVYDGIDEIISKFGDSEALSIKMPDSDRYLMINAFWDDLGCQSLSVPLYDDVSIRSAFEDVAKDGPMVSAFQTPQLMEYVEDDERIGWDMAEAVVNMMLIMQSYPEYITKTKVKTRMPGAKKAKGQTDRIMLGKPSNLRQQVAADPGTGASENSNGSEKHRRPHLRSGHWRRQRHRADWELANPDVGIVVMPDGGHAHMVHIEPLWIDPSQGDN
jgi:hypothetical protein